MDEHMDPNYCKVLELFKDSTHVVVRPEELDGVEKPNLQTILDESREYVNVEKPSEVRIREEIGGVKGKGKIPDSHLSGRGSSSFREALLGLGKLRSLVDI